MDSRVPYSKRILAVASGGGHWAQLKRLLPAFEGHRVMFVTVDAAYREQIPGARFHVVNDANKWDKPGVVKLALQMLWIVLCERPNVIVSTGAAPGFFALMFGKMIGARTAWVDSIANVECLSLSGQLVRRYADLWLTQWPELARPGGPEFKGTVI
jgi:hypothetical protein